MTNYKPNNYQEWFDFAGYVHVIGEAELFKVITLISPSLTVGSHTFHNVKKGTDYTVPANRKTKIVTIKHFDPGHASTVIERSEDIDASTNPNTMFGPGIVQVFDDVYMKSSSAATGLRINERIVTTANNTNTFIYALEEAA